MTIIYQYKVATTSFFGFFKLLRRWRGSVYKLMFKETLIFCSMYTIISLTYRLALNAYQRSVFEKLVVYCNSYTNLIPVSFVLGFYVTVVVTRWWQQFRNVPWPDRTLYILGSYLVGLDERGRIYRRTVARYMMFGLILILRSVSVSVMKRYPTMEHIVEAGFVTHEEVVMYENVECKFNKFWVPLVWANSVLTQARKEGRIESEIGFRLIIEQIADFRDKCSLCFVYDWISIPLVYTQVVTLSVHIFFGACLIGRQYVQEDEDNPDFYVPFFTLLQFFFYMGWLKVAEQMINPFGEDDDDFDMNWLIDRHTAVAMCLADQCHANYPPLTKDVHFNEITTELPYTEAAMSSKRPMFLGSTYNLERPSMQEQRVLPTSPLVDGQHPPPPLRQRSNTGPRHHSGSVWSLFGFRPNLQRGGFGGSRDTIKSTSTMMNGHVNLGPLNSSNQPREHRDSRGSRSSGGSRFDISSDLPPEYVPLKRARATTDAPHRPLQRVVDIDRERKWSFPLSLLRRKQERDLSERGMSVSSSASQEYNSREDLEPLLTPPLQRSRFTVESVPGDNSNIDASKQARNKQLLDKHMGYMAVSRPPVLSAIEEGNTIRSVKDLIPSPSSHSLETMEENPYVGDGEIPIPTTIEEEEYPEEEVFEEEKAVDRFEPVDNTPVKEMIQTNETFKQIMFPINENESPQLFHVNEKPNEDTPDNNNQAVEMSELKTEKDVDDTIANADTQKHSESGEFKLTDTDHRNSLNLSDLSSDVQTNITNIPTIVLPDDL